MPDWILIAAYMIATTAWIARLERRVDRLGGRRSPPHDRPPLEVSMSTPRTVTISDEQLRDLALVLGFCANDLPLEFKAEAEAAQRLEDVFGMRWGRVLSKG